MARSPAANRWIYGAAFVALSLAIVLGHILPVGRGPDGYPGPDLLLCVAIAWVLRRPHYLPTLLIAAVFLMSDILLMRPLGLWTALVVLGVEWLRGRESTLRELPFAAEYGTVAAVIVALHLINYLVLLLFAVPHASLVLSALTTGATLVAYPLVVGAGRLLFKVEKMRPVDLEAARRLR